MMGSREIEAMHVRIAVALFSMVVLAYCSGCGGDKRCPVNGEVTFQGQPVPEGSISFEPADGKGPTTGGPILNGQYRLDGDAAPLPGKKVVRISGGRKTGRKVHAGEPFPKDVMMDEFVRLVPDTYGPRSNLTCEITLESTNKTDFHLK
jgi:hypothetical protein